MTCTVTWTAWHERRDRVAWTRPRGHRRVDTAAGVGQNTRLSVDDGEGKRRGQNAPQIRSVASPLRGERLAARLAR